MERDVAVWWTMVIAGRYRADDGGFYGKLSVGRLFQNAPHLSPSHSLVCSGNKMLVESRK